MQPNFKNSHKSIIMESIREHLILFCFLVGIPTILPAQQPQRTTEKKSFNVSGFVYEQEGNKTEALPYAAVSISEYGVSTITDKEGFFNFSGSTPGKVRMSVSYMGKIPIDTVLYIDRDLLLNFTLKEDNFRLKEVVVAAENRKDDQSTASLITRTAMDHMQATSLTDIMNLLPGNLIRNQDLSSATQLTIRSIAGSNMNALGTSVIQDGAPISNNANLQTMHPAVEGATSPLAGGASPAGGVDARGITTDNLESVEVIRGVPSVQYGDLTSGVVIVNTKAGRDPLRVHVKVNPNVSQFSAGKGFSLGENKGALNVSGDYAYDTKSTTQSYLYYQRVTARALYSNHLLDNKWNTNTSLNFIYGKDTRKLNPDDETAKRASEGKDAGIRFNTNGMFRLNLGLLKNIQYAVSTSYTAKSSFYSELHTSANAPYSMSTTDGAILSNKPGVDIYDDKGEKITHIPPADANHYAQYLPASYLGREEIEGREFNLFYQVKATFFKNIGGTNHRVVIGTDGKWDKNYGKGKTFSPQTPPYRVLWALNSTFRPRNYRDIPAVRQNSLYAEENFNYTFADRDLNIQAGVRYDNYSVVNGIWTTRINASLDVIPGWLSIRGGYGSMAKAPTQLYLYPEKAYFEYVNINEMAYDDIPENERVFVTTTKVYDTQNRELEIAKNTRKEIGFDLKVKQARLSVTAFDDRMLNGYSMGTTLNTFRPFTYKEYERAGDGTKPVYTLVESNPVLSKFYTPTNNLVVKTKGIEYELDLGRIDAIRTQINVNGAWLKAQTYDKDYFYFDDYNTTGGSGRTHVGLYEKGMSKYNTEQFVTTLRLTHNIPEIGFVITLTSQAIWKDANWYTMGNDSIPVKFISKNDGLVYDFDPAKKDEPEFTGIIRNVNDKVRIKESLSSPVFCFNINLTKEIGKHLRLSFFANNLFSSYPKRESKRYPREYLTYNNPFFFGLELGLKL